MGTGVTARGFYVPVQLGKLGSRGRYWAEGVPEPSCWRDPRCAYGKGSMCIYHVCLFPTSGSSSQSAREGSGCGHWCSGHVLAMIWAAGHVCMRVYIYTHTQKEHVYTITVHMCIFMVSLCALTRSCAQPRCCSTRPAFRLLDPARCFLPRREPSFSLLLSLPSTSVPAPLPALGSPILPGCSRERGIGAEFGWGHLSRLCGHPAGFGLAEDPQPLWSQPSSEAGDL